MTNCNQFLDSTESDAPYQDENYTFFLKHLGHVYCLNYHLLERLPEIAQQTHNSELEAAILKTCNSLIAQISQLKEIFRLLNADYSKLNCESIAEMVEDAFSEIYLNASNLTVQNLAVQYYISTVENLELGSFRILHTVALSINNSQVMQLLQKNIKEFKAGFAWIQNSV